MRVFNGLTPLSTRGQVVCRILVAFRGLLIRSVVQSLARVFSPLKQQQHAIWTTDTNNKQTAAASL